jgi:sulfoxide reductase heme-binding subunit YedZ
MSSDALWYLGRGTGIVSLLLFTVVTVLGIAARSGRPLFGLPRFATPAIHRNASLLAVCTLAVHIVTMILDPYAFIRLVDVVIPFRAGYRPLWTGLGAVAVDLLIAVVLTSLLRQRVGVRVWRTVHWAAYALWPVAMLHALGSGSDIGFAWMRLLAAGCAAMVLAAVVWRLSPNFGQVGQRLPRLRPHALTGRRRAPALTSGAQR